MMLMHERHDPVLQATSATLPVGWRQLFLSPATTIFFAGIPSCRRGDWTPRSFVSVAPPGRCLWLFSAVTTTSLPLLSVHLLRMIRAPFGFGLDDVSLLKLRFRISSFLEALREGGRADGGAAPWVVVGTPPSSGFPTAFSGGRPLRFTAMSSRPLPVPSPRPMPLRWMSLLP